jgi:hypothetical protein
MPCFSVPGSLSFMEMNRYNLLFSGTNFWFISVSRYSGCTKDRICDRNKFFYLGQVLIKISLL